MRIDRITRRHAFLGLAALYACRRKETPRPAAFEIPTAFAGPSTADAGLADGGTEDAEAGAPARFVLDTWSLGSDREVAVTYPRRAPLDGGEQRYPVLIALHGRGEARKAPKDGAMGWFRDYDLLRALERIEAPPLSPADFRGFVDAGRLAQINAELAAKPYAGLIVVCPYLPDIDMQKPAQASAYGRYLVNTLLPEIHARTPCIKGAASLAIDGVSLGGATALQVGFEHPNVFGSVGGIQPAIQSADTTMWVERATRARSRNAAQKLRLLTSTQDYFRDGIRAFSAELKNLGHSHKFLEAPGPHDYVFNQGPGAYELLYFHERMLAR
jgi:iron(III)-salmochelin esterase